MAVLKMEPVELTRLLDKLSGVIDFHKDLPSNVFVNDGLLFWFFERPLLCFSDVFYDLVLQSISSFKSDVVIKFSGNVPLADSCFFVNGDNVGGDTFWLNKGFEAFFNGQAGYPIVLFNGSCVWVAFESAYEEFGVIAVNASAQNKEFCEYLQSNFISKEKLFELASGSSAESTIAKAFIASYYS